MPIRLIIILAMLAQQFALSAAFNRADQAESCGVTSCCTMVTMTTCCGTVVQEMQCGKSGGACLCAHEPCESDSTPAAPRPTDQRDLGPFLVTGHATLVGLINEGQLPGVTPIASHRTDRDTQALLCIWRT